MNSIPDLLKTAVQYHQVGNWNEAEQLYRQILQIHPQQPDALHLLGLVCHETGRREQAIELIKRALEFLPNFAEGYHNLGKAYRDQQNHAEAEKYYRKAVELKPVYAEAHFNLGNALRDQRKFDEAMECYERALQLKPNHSSARFVRAITWMLQGDFERGWPEYEWRWQRNGKNTPELGKPVWDGSPLNGRTVLLYAEQGFGDTFQFIRYAPLVQQKGGTVIVSAQKPLLPVLARCAGVDRWEKQGDPLPPFDVHASLMSLPALFHHTLATIPQQVPYIFPDPQLEEKWRNELKAISGLKIGIVWQGSPTNERDHIRSIALSHYEPIAKCPGVRLLSLQKKVGIEQLQALQENFNVIDLGSRLDENTGAFMDTAAVMKSLDLVITSDTAIAHLAGALGVPVWVGIPYVADWRWLADRDDSPWYPTMRLFRQSEWGDWNSVFQRMAKELELLVAAKNR